VRGEQGQLVVQDWATQGGGVYWDSVSERWLDAHPQRLWRRHSDLVNTALLERWLPTGLKSVLKTDLFDEAVSTGLYPALAERADHVVGIDDSRAIVESAVERHPGLDGRRADVRALPFDDGEFDAVVSNSTLDHFDSAKEIFVALRELHRVLEVGGTLVVTLDNPANPILAVTKALPRRTVNRAWARIGGASSRAGLLPYYVGATLGIRRLRRVLSELGFAVVDTTAIVHVPRVLAVLVGNVLERHGGAASEQRFLRALGSFERLSRRPTRFVTGHFVGACAVKLDAAGRQVHA
jgi:SAM-dependent methyltransferase